MAESGGTSGGSAGFNVWGESIQAVGSAWLSFAQADAMRAQAKFQQTMADFNARLAELQGADAIERGDKAANQIKKSANFMVGSQRAALAANGVEVDYGSAAQIQADTVRMATIDAITVRNNAAREAWGYKVQAMNYRFTGQAAAIGANMNAGVTIATGGINGLSHTAKAYGYSQMGGKTLDTPTEKTPTTTTAGVDYNGGRFGGIA